MRRAAAPLFSSLLLLACAHGRVHQFLSQRTEGYVFARPVTEVWPVIKELLEERGFIPDEKNGPYRLETAMLTPDGELPTTARTSSAAADGASRGSGGRGGGRRGGAGPAPDHAGGEVWRFVVNGEEVDDSHCRVRIILFRRESLYAPEAPGERAAELEWDLISRVEPERAAAIRKDSEAAGLTLPQ